MKKFVVLILMVLIAGYAGAQTKTAMKTTDLRKEITDHITKNYPGYKIAEAFKVETNKVATFEVIIQKEAAKTTLVYNDKGEFVKKEADKSAAVKSVNKTTTTAKTTSAKPQGVKPENTKASTPTK